MKNRFVISQIKRQIKYLKEQIESEEKAELRIHLRGQIEGLYTALQFMGE